MRKNNNFNFQVFIFISIMCFSNSVVYGQEIMEDALVSVSYSEENETKTITATATDQTGLPIEDLDLYFFVERTFSLLPIGDGFNMTDENGVVEIEFPNDLPGDTEGNLVIITKILESDLYNDLSIESTKNWGVPVILEDPKNEKRSLWAAAANAPISLILIVSLMILSVWYIICYIIYNLFSISKINPLKED